MDILKTPHQKLLEEAGAAPASPGMVNTPQQMLMQESGILPQYAGGGKVLGKLADFLSESKIPQRLYHGTTASEKGGAEALQQLKQSKEGALGAGVYMTPNPEFASQYANAPGGYVMPVHANLRNPLEIHSTTGGGDPMKAALMQLGVPEAKAEQIIEKAYDTRGYVGKEVMSRAQKQGYDGLAQYHDGNLSEVVSYNPMGVKSATGNSGEFNPYDPRLSKAEGGYISNMEAPSSLPDVSFDVRNIPSMSGMAGVGYQQDPQGAMARMQLEQQLKNKARLRAGVSGLGMAIPGQHGVKMMPGEMNIGAKFPVGPGNLDISARRSINPIPGRGHEQGINAQYSMTFAEGGSVSPEDMIAELIHNGHLPEHFASGGRALLPELNPYFQNVVDRSTAYNFDQMMDEANPEPTFQAQPQTLTSKARDKVAAFIGEKPADRLFGTGSEGQKLEYLPLQLLNPVSATTETIDAVPETVNQLRRGETLGAGFTAGAAGLGVLPFMKPVKNIIKKIKHK